MLCMHKCAKLRRTSISASLLGHPRGWRYRPKHEDVCDKQKQWAAAAVVHAEFTHGPPEAILGLHMTPYLRGEAPVNRKGPVCCPRRHLCTNPRVEL